jgi:dynein heavy chain
VEKKKEEAYQNYKYLSPLIFYFEKLNSKSENCCNYGELGSILQSIFHLIYLIWKNSTHYNQGERIIVLLREFCNDLIKRSKVHLDIDNLFSLDINEAVNRIESILYITSLLKKFYFGYKVKLEEEGKEWTVSPTLIFYRLDKFLQLCRDILESLVKINKKLSLDTIEEFKNNIKNV